MSNETVIQHTMFFNQVNECSTDYSDDYLNNNHYFVLRLVATTITKPTRIKPSMKTILTSLVYYNIVNYCAIVNPNSEFSFS